jgi:hypothetical protein
MTEINKSKKEKPYVPFSTWASDVVSTVQLLQDEVLDRYYEDKKFANEVLKLLNKIRNYVDKKR